MVNIILCFASYEDKKGMYKNISVNLEDFYKESIEAELVEYYKGINVEEFFLADAWTDDNDTLSSIIVKNYTEFYKGYFEFLEGLKENLEGMNLECFEVACYQNPNCRDINYLIKYSENINIIENIWDYFEECVNVENSELATSLFQMNNEEEAVEDLRHLGFDLCEYNEMIFEDCN